ncbi:MAG: helix-turn-helix domain-containing protein [Bacteroidota bacterium]
MPVTKIGLDIRIPIMQNNKELDLAWNFVNQTDRNIFLTGKAGTGKTTFLKRLKNESLKRMVVVAPTGVAAINAKGVTIHSFFQLAFGPIVPNAPKQSSGFNRKFNKTKINIIKSLDLLVIDEISMVRCDLLDGIDETLRRYRDRSKPFGGVQVLMIGDLQQLSPVVKDNDWQILQPFYQTAFFFSSKVFQASDAITIELKHIYRQDNPKFINILNEIRNNTLSQESIFALNQRYNPEFEPDEEDGYIHLTTHNNKAKYVNDTELEKLKGKLHKYEAKIEGKFPEYSYPNNPEMELKVGAQVMFVKNDSSQEKRYFNGKIGKIIHLEKNEVVVKCPDDDFNIEVTPETWENISYAINPETKEITEDKKGAYIQMPLRLAWAITIHKSQGLTFERAIIDAQGAFAHGQTYVALSRCKSLEGLVLKSKISTNEIINDGNVNAFNKSSEENQPDEVSLQSSMRNFQLGLISEIFDFYKFLYPTRRILDVFYNNRNSVQGNIEKIVPDIKTALATLLKVADGFKKQLQELSKNSDLPENDKHIQERFTKAIIYFEKETHEKITEPFQKLAFTTDNKAVDADLTKAIDEFDALLDTKRKYFNQLAEGFSLVKFLELRGKSKVENNERGQKKKRQKIVIESTSNVDLFERLRLLRNELADELDLIHYQIFTQKSLYEMCELLPVTKSQLLKINGFGKKRVEKYGEEILDVIMNYCDEHNLETGQLKDYEHLTIEKKKPAKISSNQVSFEMFKSGKTIDEIAKERGLVTGTIFSHLASFIETGEIKPTDLISEEKFNELKELIPKYEFESLTELKNQLDEKYSYEDLRMALKVLNQ